MNEPLLLWPLALLKEEHSSDFYVLFVHCVQVTSLRSIYCLPIGGLGAKPHFTLELISLASGTSPLPWRRSCKAEKLKFSSLASGYLYDFSKASDLIMGPLVILSTSETLQPSRLESVGSRLVVLQQQCLPHQLFVTSVELPA